MMDSNIKRQLSREEALDALLSNENISKVISEGMNAPLGSTKRTKAQVVLSSLKKKKPKYDGKGGPGDVQNYFTSSGMSQDQLFKGTGSYDLTGIDPTGRYVNNIDPNATEQGPPLAIQRGQSNGLVDLGMTPLKSTQNVLDQNPSQFIWAPPLPERKRLEDNGAISRIVNPEYYNLDDNTRYKLMGATMSVQNMADKYMGPRLTIKTNSSGQIVDDSTAMASLQDGMINPNKPVTAADFTNNKAGGVDANGDGVITTDERQDFSSSGSNDYVSVTDIMNDEGFEDDFNNLSESEQSQFIDIINAVNSGYGGQMTAQMIMSDREALKRLFPDVPEEDLPVGASLSRQINDLYLATKKEYGLDEMYNDYLRRSDTLANADQILNDFVRGKDNYVKHIDGMLDGLYEYRATADLSNPWNRKKINMYEGYLTTMKGRQQKRYTDLINDTISQYQNDVNTRIDLYNKRREDFVEEFTMKKDITTEDYERLYGSIVDMYDNLYQAQFDNIELSTAYYKLLEAQKDAMGTASGLADTLADYDVLYGEPKTEGIFDNAAKNLGSIKRIDSNGKEQPIVFSDASMSDLVNAGYVNGYSTDDIIKDAAREIANNGAAYAKNPSAITEFIDAYQPWAAELAEGVQMYGSDPNYGPQSQEYQQQMEYLSYIKKQIINVVSRAMSNRANESEDEMRAGVEDAINVRTWLRGDQKVSDKIAQKMEEATSSSDPFLAGIAYNALLNNDIRNYTVSNEIEALVGRDAGNYKNINDIPINTLIQNAVNGWDSYLNG